MGEKKIGVMEWWSTGVLGVEKQESWLSAAKSLGDAIEFY
jgi:hypothetical protein